MSRRPTSLLDVNVLVALFDPDHVHHDLAHDWFADHRSDGWATCPITENGVIRVLANPAYGSPISGVAAVADLLKRFTASPQHEFWDDTLSLTDDAVFTPAAARGHRQVTDIYLLGLAAKHGGRLVTFDRGIPVRAVKGADVKTLAVIEPVS